MTKAQKWFVLICLVVGLGLGSLVAQLQQSGGPGSNVTISQGGNSASVDAGGALKSNVAEVGGSALALGQTTMSASLPVAIASNQGALSVSQSGTWNVGLSAGTNSIGKVTPISTCGTTAFTQAWAAVPTSTTAVTATTTCVQAIIFNNTNATPQTVSVTDGQGSPITVVSTFSIPGNSEVTFPFYGSPMTSGVKWSAGGTGVNGSVVGWQ